MSDAYRDGAGDAPAQPDPSLAVAEIERGGDWSEPALFGRSVLAEPRMFTEANPLSTAFYLGDGRARDESPWSSPSYFGPRRYRPVSGTGPAAGGTTGAGVADGAQPAAPSPTSPRPTGRRRAPAANRGLLASSRTMAVASLVSRITGFLRSSMLVAAIGVATVGDAYNVANNFPNMLYELLLGGVLSSVLIPLLVHAQEQDEDRGVAYTQRLLSIATAALGVMTLLAVACAPLIASGFVRNVAERNLTSIFATLLLPEIFFYGLGAMFMAVLNIRGSFGPGAWAPVLNNVIMIATIGLFWLVPGPATLNPATMTTTQVLVLGLGTTLGIAAQGLVLLPALRRTGFVWEWRFRARPNEVGRMREVSSLAGWVLAYVVISQVGVTVIAKVGVSHGAFTTFTQADLLLQMPYGILVVSLFTALMPRLSRSATRGETSAVVADLGLGARLSALALLPITAGFIVLGPVLTVVLFAYGQTSIADARLIGVSLAISAFGLFPFALVMLQLRVFYAMRDGRTPTLINAFMVATKVAIVIVCDASLHGTAHIAEALTTATSASYVVGAVLGHVVLTRRLGKLGFASVARCVARVGAASAIGGLAAYGAVLVCRSAFGHARVAALTGLLSGAVIGLIVFVIAVRQLYARGIAELLGSVRGDSPEQLPTPSSAE